MQNSMLYDFFNLAGEFTFAWPWVFILLPLPFLVRLLKPVEQANSVYLRLPFYTKLASHIQNSGSAQAVSNKLLMFTLLLIWLFLVVATARPQLIGNPVSLPVSGRDLMLAIDISGSMETPDMTLNYRPVTRLEAVKEVAADFITRRQGDRLGLILFGQQAYLQTPLTFDTKTVHIFLEEAVIGLAGKETAIGDAIGLGVKRLTKKTKENRVLILLTDGANTAGNISPIDATELASKAEVTIYTIGIGAEAMQVQGFFGMQTVNPSANLDEKTLQEIAQKTGGQYFRAKDTESLEKIYALLDELEPISEENKTYRPIDELYPYPLGIALSLGALLLLLNIVKTKALEVASTK